MIPKEKIKAIVTKHNNLEKELASGNLNSKNFSQKSKEYSDLNTIVISAREYLKYEEEKKDLELIISDKKSDKEMILLAGNGGQAAAAAFIGAGRQVRLASGRMISTDAADQGVDDISVNAGMIARLAAHYLALGKISPLTPLYLADPRLGPKKRASA